MPMLAMMALVIFLMMAVEDAAGSGKVSYTYQGQECTSVCKRHSDGYWWCEKAERWEGGGRGKPNKDSWWDYCSPNNKVTRYNKPCQDFCTAKEKGYYWCTTEDGEWDYCSPPSREKSTTKKKSPKTASGRPCIGVCGYMGERYMWCTIKGNGGSGDWWDYCGPYVKTSAASPQYSQSIGALLSLTLILHSVNHLWIYHTTRSSGPYGPLLLAPAEGIGGPFGPSLGALRAPNTSPPPHHLLAKIGKNRFLKMLFVTTSQNINQNPEPFLESSFLKVF